MNFVSTSSVNQFGIKARYYVLPCQLDVGEIEKENGIVFLQLKDLSVLRGQCFVPINITSSLILYSHSISS